MFDNRKTSHRASFDRLCSHVAALSILGLVAALPGAPARADTSEDDGWAARFDLGVDVGLVPKTSAGVRNFLSTFDPESQAVLMKSCEHYVLNPGPIAIDTKNFCRAAMGIGSGISGNTRVFGVFPARGLSPINDQPTEQPGRHRVYTLDPDATEFWDWGNSR